MPALPHGHMDEKRKLPAGTILYNGRETNAFTEVPGHTDRELKNLRVHGLSIGQLQDCLRGWREKNASYEILSPLQWVPFEKGVYIPAPFIDRTNYAGMTEDDARAISTLMQVQTRGDVGIAVLVSDN